MANQPSRVFWHAHGRPLFVPCIRICLAIKRNRSSVVGHIGAISLQGLGQHLLPRRPRLCRDIVVGIKLYVRAFGDRPRVRVRAVGRGCRPHITDTRVGNGHTEGMVDVPLGDLLRAHHAAHAGKSRCDSTSRVMTGRSIRAPVVQVATNRPPADHVSFRASYVVPHVQFFVSVHDHQMVVRTGGRKSTPRNPEANRAIAIELQAGDSVDLI